MEVSQAVNFCPKSWIKVRNSGLVTLWLLQPGMSGYLNGQGKRGEAGQEQAVTRDRRDCACHLSRSTVIAREGRSNLGVTVLTGSGRV